MKLAKVICIIALLGTSHSSGLNQRIHLLELQMSRDTFRTKSDIMELRELIQSVNSSVNVCTETDKDVAIISEREKRIEEEKQLDYSLKAAKRFDVLALAISKEKSATRRFMEKFQDQVERKVMNFVNKTNQSIVGIDKMGTEVKETVQQYSYNISSFEQTLNNIQKTVSDLYGGFGEIKDAISKIENELIKLKHENKEHNLTLINFKASGEYQLKTQNYSLHSKECPSTWVRHENRCYLYNQSNTLSWSSAVLQCQELGGELAEADTVAEMNYLLGFTNSTAWFGASDRAVEGKFVWRSSKMPLEYLPWKPGQPNNYGGDQDCLSTWDSLLNDENCQVKLHFICEK